MKAKTAALIWKGAIALAGNPWIMWFVSLVKAKQLRSLVRRVARKAGMRQPDGFETSVPRIIPRNIWIFWDQGIDSAPEVVKMCIKSWHARNPGWTVRVLDRDSVAEFATMSPLSPDISIQSYANLLRLKLLKERGGVWADATAFCVKPLDEWLPIVAQRGFFAFFWTKETRWFTWPGYTRDVANWFLASESNNTIMADWEQYCFRYWENRKKPHLYFWCQTLFELLIYMRRPFRQALRSVPKISCLGPHLVHDCIVRERDIARVAHIIDSGAAPVQKLRWQWDEQKLAIAKTLLNVKDSETSKQSRAS